MDESQPPLNLASQNYPDCNLSLTRKGYCGTMAIVGLIAMLLVGAYTTAYLWDNGVHPRTRGSMRYQRRKANRLGVGFNDVSVRTRNDRYPIPESRHGSHIKTLNRTVSLTLLLVVGVLAIVIAGLLLAYAPDFGWPLALVLLFSAGWLVYRREA
ncbi:hypothetical protein [Sphingobium ummariense]|uniref:hypothetical protein n=1 Tax=Sphingobium ummariense TaxID=420994 RepID=UPI001268BBC1|nr:hypothetical protein [Sphingobium ummariense]